VERLENGDVVAELCERTRARQAGRTAADDRAAKAAGLGDLGNAAVLDLTSEVDVAQEALKPPYGDGFAFLGKDARRLALLLLRAHTAAHGG